MKLKKYMAGVKHDRPALSGFGTQLHTGQHEIAIISTSRRALRKIWPLLSSYPFDPDMVQPVTIFQTKSLTSKRLVPPKLIKGDSK